MANLARSRVVRASLVVGVVAFLVALGIFTSLWLHFHNAPDFDAYLRTRPVSAKAVAARWPDAEVLADGPAWRRGELDPFEVADEDPMWRKHSLRFTADVKHGEEVLATVVQEVAIAADRVSGEREGAAVRMQCPQLDPRLHVIARIWLDDENLIGPGSLQHGHATFDIMVVAGGGPNECSVARMPKADLPPLNPSDPEAEFGSRVCPVFDPGGAVLELGMIYHVRRSVWLAWTDGPSGSQSAGFEGLSTWMSTDEYSYSIFCKTEDAGWSSTHENSAKLSWNGRVW